MLTQICQYLKNWFNRKPDGSLYPTWSGEFTIENGSITGVELATGQYFRIMGSLFNDGVHEYGDNKDVLKNETFVGAIWSMGVPPEVVSLAAEIGEWMKLYGGIDSPAMSPYDSESFGGYSYSKQQGFASTGGGMLTAWQAVYASRLNPWRKI